MLYLPKQQSTLTLNTKQENQSACAQVLPMSSCPDWRRSSHGSSTWWDQSAFSWHLLSNSLKHRYIHIISHTIKHLFCYSPT